VSVLLKALAEPRRQQILRFVLDAERSAGDIHRALGEITFGAVSQHLRVLSDAGAVRVRRDGRRRLYRADKRTLRPFRAHLERAWSEALADLKRLAEAEDRR
jgi:DNA-binding transcriptional ArsR family regulator